MTKYDEKEREAKKAKAEAEAKREAEQEAERAKAEARAKRAEERIQAKIAEMEDPRNFEPGNAKPFVFQSDQNSKNFLPFAIWREKAWKIYVQCEGITELKAPDDAQTDDNVTRAEKADKRAKLKIIWMNALYAAINKPTKKLLGRLHVADPKDVEENLDALQTHFTGQKVGKMAEKQKTEAETRHEAEQARRKAEKEAEKVEAEAVARCKAEPKRKAEREAEVEKAEAMKRQAEREVEKAEAEARRKAKCRLGHL